MTIELRYQPYRLFPYERVLARRELSALGLEVVDESASTIIATGSSSDEELSRLTYFESVRNDGRLVEPDLAVLERQHLERRAAATRLRQATRYLVHGLHEYKGKFHPHLVRAFANLLRVEADQLVIDPFCGSGTTLVEATLLGANSVGVDMSPIAVAITEAKLAVLQAHDRRALGAEFESWSAKTLPAVDAAWARKAATCESPLDEDARAYLGRWFSPAACAALTETLAALADIRSLAALHKVAAIAVSSILRETSEQAPEDLRIRRRAVETPAADFPAMLRGALQQAATAIAEAADTSLGSGAGKAVLGDVTEPGLLRDLRGDTSRAVVITSPPYATALPYVDTDRLSLVALGLASPPELHRLEASLIGSREWLRDEAARWVVQLESNASNLPDEVTSICARISATASGAGFRRRAMPGLLYRYFSDMAGAFAAIRAALRPSEPCVFVVGVNRTGRGADEVVIDTPALLAGVSASRGFNVEEVLSLETWPRYGLHHDNGVRGESAVILSAS